MTFSWPDLGEPECKWNNKRHVCKIFNSIFFCFLDTDNQHVIIHVKDFSEAIPQDESSQQKHSRQKRRVTRAVRPTKRIEFAESDGDTEGRNVFQLEKETERETFKIRDDNPWVTVETNGAVRVKKKWDYEELGPEKTIDFWVIISNQGHNGKFFVTVWTEFGKGQRGFEVVLWFDQAWVLKGKNVRNVSMKSSTKNQIKTFSNPP